MIIDLTKNFADIVQLCYIQGKKINEINLKKGSGRRIVMPLKCQLFGVNVTEKINVCCCNTEFGLGDERKVLLRDSRISVNP